MRLQVNVARAAGVLASVAVFGFQLAAVEPAGAVIAQTGSGHTVSYQPSVERAAVAHALAPIKTARRAASPQAGVYKECAASPEGACLSYYEGPVMRTTTLTPVFWNPTGLSLSYPEKYETEIEQFIANLAADSGKETNFFSVLTQYYEEVGVETDHVNYTVTVGAAQTDTKALPTGAGEKCPDPFSRSRACVSDKGLRAELNGFIKSKGLIPGIGHEYVVFFPPGMDSCFAESGEESKICSGTYYCGYHGALNALSPEEVEYANEPDNADPEYGTGCTPKGSMTPAEVTLNTASHEISESVTDPEVGAPRLTWYDEEILTGQEYGEIGDMCGWEFKQGDPALGLHTGATKLPVAFSSDQTINGHPYLLQTEWDNAHSTCSISERMSATKAAFTDSAIAAVHTGDTVSFNATSSFAPVAIEDYEWDWGDGTSTSGVSPTREHAYANSKGVPTKTFTVTLTVTDANGNKKSISHPVEVVNRPPSAEFAATSTLTTGATSTFDASGSKDTDGTIASYSWNFGDGSPAQEGETPSHIYAAPGEYTVTLTVTDDAGATASKSHSFTVAPTPDSKTSTIGGEGGATPPNVVHVTGSKQNKKKGTVALSVTVLGAGVLTAHEASTAHSSLVTPLAGALAAPAAYPVALVAAAKGKAKAKGPFVKSVSITVGAAGTVTIQIVPNAAGNTLLRSKHKLALKILIAFTPAGGTQGTLLQPVTLVLSPAKKHK